MLRNVITRLVRDETGASMVEYTVLLGVTLGVSLAVMSVTGAPVKHCVEQSQFIT